MKTSTAPTSPPTDDDRPEVMAWTRTQIATATRVTPMASTANPFQEPIGRSSCALLFAAMRSMLLLRCGNVGRGRGLGMNSIA